jgi:capsular exopolysaccharide synthesis family protein
MSRIDEALRRARIQRGGVSGPEADDQTPEEGAAGDAVPWSFDSREAPADDRAAPPSRPRPADAGPAPGGRPAAAPRGAPSLAVFRGFDKTLAEKLVVAPRVASTSVEQYRKLAATLHHAQVDRGIHTVLVASAVAGEGKTLTSTNLALTFSESYKRSVLLIDADLRRPSVHDVFQVPNVSGLSDGLTTIAEQKLSIVQVSPRLSILTAGKPDPDPMGNLTSPRMEHILQEATERFDWVIIDSPPVGLMTDANLLAAMVDVALVVVNAGVTSYELVQKAVDALGRDKVFGVVLNRVEEGVVQEAYSSYYYYYKSDGRFGNDR